MTIDADPRVPAEGGDPAQISPEEKEAPAGAFPRLLLTLFPFLLLVALLLLEVLIRGRS